MKVSLCTVCMNRAQHIKQTLEKNILDNLDHAATEIILVDYNSKDDLEEYIRTHLGKYLESGKLIYYRSYTPQYFNRSHSRNIAFKMATGDIICNVDADNFTGEGFASHLNSLFGSIKNHFFYANEKFDVIGRIAVRRENFYRIGGFDERMVYYGFEDTDFMHRLVKSGLKPGIIAETKYLSALSHSNKDRMANEYVVNNYYKIFVCFLTYSSSKVLVLFKDNTFFIGTLINRLNLDTAKPDLTDQRRQYDYAIAEHRWLEGRWKEEGTSYSFSYDTDKTLHLSHTDGDLYRSQGSDTPTTPGTTVYYALTNKTLVEEALFFYSQLTNRMIFENNLASPEYTVNKGIFGHDIVYKNFDPHSNYYLTMTTTNTNTWIRLSVFYPRAKWHLLIAGCLSPLMKELQHRRLATIYILALNAQQGDNIRLSISVRRISAEAAAKKIDDSIRTFLQRSPSVTVKVTHRITGFFMDIASNSLLYNMFVKPEEIPAENTMRYRLSNSFIRAVGTEPIGNTILFSFLLYIQASVLHLHHQVPSLAAEKLGTLIDHLGQRLPPDKAAEMDLQRDSLFKKNREDLQGIINEVWNTQQRPATPSLNWLSEWRNALRQYFSDGLTIAKGYETISYFTILQIDYPEKGISYVTSGLLYLALKNEVPVNTYHPPK